MRVLIANWTNRVVGGAETYLDAVMPCLASRGHQIGFVCELDAPADRALLAIPPGAPRWSLADAGRAATRSAVRSWQPDLVFVHQLEDPGFESDLMGIAPTVLFAHNYRGACISGGKCFTYPVARPCQRRFGWPCLLHYYPHRCGGLNPITMLRAFGIQKKHNQQLREHTAIVTASQHMRREILKHGVADERVRRLTHFARPSRGIQPQPIRHEHESPSEEPVSRLLFLGRMDYLKGGRLLLNALPSVRAGLDNDIRLTMAGDGPDRLVWERKAQQIQDNHEGITVQFCGWISDEAIVRVFQETDLLVVPSTWPEPFGQVGPEAGRHGVPAVAFDVGGIPEWLRDGVNGHLAPSSPPTASGLADAIVKALRDPLHHAKLQKGAQEVASRFTMDRHLAELEAVLVTAVRSQTGSRER